MAGAYIVTEDENLRLWLTLLLEEAELPLVSLQQATLFLVDLDTIAQREFPTAAIGFSHKGKEAPFPVFPRPFEEEAVLLALKQHKDGAPYPTFTPTEAKLFALLRRAHGEVVSARELLIGTFGEEEADNLRLLHVYMHYLRKKTEGDGRRRIFAHRGRGYSFKDVDDLP